LLVCVDVRSTSSYEKVRTECVPCHGYI
jgi:hypothetical protein